MLEGKARRVLLMDFGIAKVMDTAGDSSLTSTGTIVGTVPGEWVWPFRHQRYDNLIARLQPADA